MVLFKAWLVHMTMFTVVHDDVATFTNRTCTLEGLESSAGSEPGGTWKKFNSLYSIKVYSLLGPVAG